MDTHWIEESSIWTHTGLKRALYGHTLDQHHTGLRRALCGHTLDQHHAGLGF